MLSYSKGETTAPLLEGTIGKEFDKVCRTFGSKEALVVMHQGFRATYASFAALVDRAAASLLSLDIVQGDRVGVWSPNRYEWVVLQFATAKVGAILVNVNPAYRARELQYALTQSGVGTLFLAKGFRKTDYVALLNEVRGECPQLKTAIIIDSEWEAFLKKGDQKKPDVLEKRAVSLNNQQAINIQYTSGTTGFPKGATLTHRNILNNAWFIGERLAYTEKDAICIPVPFYHCFGMVMANLAGILRGAKLVIPSESFDPLRVFEAIEKEKCTSLYGVPTMFIAELNHPDVKKFDLTSLRTGIMSGAPCPRPVMERVQTEMHLPQLTICYGMTETSPVSTQTKPSDSIERRVSTVGSVLPHVEIKIIDENGDVVPRGTKGEFCTRGYSVMNGYWENDDATRQAIDPEGWMHSGDLATMDETGYVRIEGRLKDMIIRGGENIYPKEIEDFLLTHSSVAEVHVVGIPSEQYGEEVVAWVKSKEKLPLTEVVMRDFCKDKIATFKIPRYWIFCEEFPVTITGKIQKFRLREMAVQQLAAAK